MKSPWFGYKRFFTFTPRRVRGVYWERLEANGVNLVGLMHGVRGASSYELWQRAAGAEEGDISRYPGVLGNPFSLRLSQSFPTEMLGTARGFELPIVGDVPTLGAPIPEWLMGLTSPHWAVSDASSHPTGGSRALWFYRHPTVCPWGEDLGEFAMAIAVGVNQSGFEVTPGVSYTARAYYRQVEFKAGGAVRLRIEWNPQGSPGVTYTNGALIEPDLSNLGWVAFPDVTATAPEGALRARIILDVYMPGWDPADVYSVYFDRVSFIGDYPPLLVDSSYAYRAVFPDGSTSDYSEWLQPGVITYQQPHSDPIGKIPPVRQAMPDNLKTVLSQDVSGENRIEADTSQGGARINRISVGEVETELLRIGDLNGNWGYAAETFGIAIGEYVADTPNITIDPTNGIRIRNYSADMLTLDVSGNMDLVGSLKMRGASSAIAIGTTPPTSASAGTGIWIDRTGIYGLAANVQQAYLRATDGKIIAGAGNVTLDANGISISSGTGISNAIDWYSGATSIVDLRATSAYGSNLLVAKVQNAGAGGSLTASLQAFNSYSNYGTFSVGSVEGNNNSPYISFVGPNGQLFYVDYRGQVTTPHQFVSTLGTGTAPIVVSSTTKVTNLNADLLDGLEATAFLGASATAADSDKVDGLHAAAFALAAAGVPAPPSDATKFLNGAATPAFAQVRDSDLSTSDVTTNNVSSSKHGFAPKSPSSATQFLNGAATPAFAQVKDSDLSTSDVTTNDVSTTKHGFVPKAPNDTAKFLRGDGTWAAAGGSSGVQGSAQRTSQATTSSTTFVDVTSMSVTLTSSGGKVLVIYTTTAYDNGGASEWKLLCDSTQLDFFACSNRRHDITLMAIHAPSAASHTWKVQMRNVSGGGYTTYDNMIDGGRTSGSSNLAVVAF